MDLKNDVEWAHRNIKDAYAHDENMNQAIAGFSPNDLRHASVRVKKQKKTIKDVLSNALMGMLQIEENNEYDEAFGEKADESTKQM